MKTLTQFVKTTVAGGIFFLLPLLLLVFLLGQGLKGARHLVRPLAEQLHIHSVGNVVVLDVLAVGILVLVAFLAGLFARTAAGKKLGRKLETLILGKIPGYTLFKSAFGSGEAANGQQLAAAVIVHFDESWMLGFLIERHENGLVAVFVPSAPTPAAGTIYYLREDQIQPLQNVSVKEGWPGFWKNAPNHDLNNCNY